MKKRTRATRIGSSSIKPYTRARVHYNEDDKIAAVAILLDHASDTKGLTLEGIALVKEYLGSNVSPNTLNNWLNKYSDKVKEIQQKPVQYPQQAAVVIEAQSSALDMMQQLRDGLLKHAISTLDDTDQLKKEGIRNIVVSAAVLEDKVRTATGMSVSMQAKIKQLAMLLADDGKNIEDWVNQSITYYQMKPKKHSNDNEQADIGSITTNTGV